MQSNYINFHSTKQEDNTNSSNNFFSNSSLKEKSNGKVVFSKNSIIISQYLLNLAKSAKILTIVTLQHHEN
jgi:hypothetical protein